MSWVAGILDPPEHNAPTVICHNSYQDVLIGGNGLGVSRVSRRSRRSGCSLRASSRAARRRIIFQASGWSIRLPVRAATQHAALHLPELPGERDLDGLRARADVGAPVCRPAARNGR
jgi:hypothetical protein